MKRWNTRSKSPLGVGGSLPEEQVIRKKEEKPPKAVLSIVPPEEQVIRKKAEKPPVSIPTVPKIRKEPRPFISEKERRIGVPVIPGEPCCAKTCEILNTEIDRKVSTLSMIASLGGTYENRPYRYMSYGIEALEDLRQDLKDKRICRCIEETGAVSIMVPLMAAETKNGKLAIPSGLSMLRVRSPEVIRNVHLKEKSIVPTENACCPKSCELLNKEIDKNNKILDNMELRGGTVIYKSPRYETLSYRTFHLQEYRNELKKKGSCKCIE